MEKAVKESEIKITIGLNAEQVPVSMRWEAEDDPGQDGARECKAMILSLFDRDSLDTFRIDLWTKDMMVNEMDRFVFHTLKAMADTYYRATQNVELANDLQRFVQHFGEKTEIIPK